MGILKRLIIILLINTCILFLASCDNNNLPINQPIPINAPKIIALLNENFNTVSIQRDPNNHNYYYLKVPQDKTITQDIKALLHQKILPEDRRCFKFSQNSVGWHITILKNGSSKQMQILEDNIGKEIHIDYTSVAVITFILKHSHTREVVYFVNVAFTQDDYESIGLHPSDFKNNHKPHLTLALFKKDQNNQCVKH